MFAVTVAVEAVPSADAEPQPHMKAALAHLQKASEQLDKATADKGGHRVKALAATREAIEQVKKGIAFDDKR
ncbi:MAG: hypothetical protein H6708_26710 [Kofleriaceae bacterium]|nr:hypothetical protein [Myxococcales bacterium]MCB9564003.1 hypothetical protein [Kofleriaceae bacterium]